MINIFSFSKIRFCTDFRVLSEFSGSGGTRGEKKYSFVVLNETHLIKDRNILSFKQLFFERLPLKNYLKSNFEMFLLAIIIKLLKNAKKLFDFPKISVVVLLSCN